jgi:aspartate racemase
MKTIGLIGGMSWESTADYYRLVNEEVAKRLGGFHSARCVMVSVDFADIETLQHEGRWNEASDLMAKAACQLESAGAEFIILCTNTMHKSAGAITAAVSIPFIHIADPTAQAIRAQGIETIGLLGTRFTMVEDFYKGRLSEHFGLKVLIPNENECGQVHRVIYDELVHGIIRPESRQAYREIIAHLVARGAQGVILGCTEIGLLVKPEDSPVPVFDTTQLHAVAAVDFSLNDAVS